MHIGKVNIGEDVIFRAYIERKNLYENRMGTIIDRGYRNICGVTTYVYEVLDWEVNIHTTNDFVK